MEPVPINPKYILDILANNTINCEYLISEEGNILFITENCKTLTGYQRDEFIQNPSLLNEVIHYSDTEDGSPKIHLQDNKSTLETIISCAKIKHKDGTLKTVKIKTKILANANINGKFVSIEEILEEKRCTEIEESEDRLKMVINSIPDIICFKDGNGRWLLANDYDLNLFNLTGVDYFGKTDCELADYSPFYREAFLNCEGTDEISWQNKQPSRCIEVIPQQKGGSLHFDVYKIPMFKDNGERKGLLVVGRDLTELLEAKRKAEESNRAKTDFLATISHEVRTPINGIIGMLDLLKNSGLQENQVEYVETAEYSALMLLSIINDILEYSKLDSGHSQQYEPSEFNIDTLINKLVKTIEPLAKEKNLWLKLKTPKSAAGRFIGDKKKISQILINLLNNAVKFTSHGGITLSVTSTECSDGSHKMTFTVSDTGVGIPEEKIKSIFDPFFQVDSSMSRQFGGTGLGLSICTKLAKIINGEISVYSEEGKGSDFVFNIALKKASDIIVNKIQTSSMDNTKQKYSGKALVVEDNSINQKILTSILEQLGFTPESAFDGLEGVLLAKNNDYKIIFMDIHLPKMDGLAAVEEIRKAGITIPVVAITADLLKINRESCIDAGMNEFISKPFKIADIANALKILFENK